MSDELRERLPDEALGDDPAVRGTRSDIGATGSGVVGPAPGVQEVRETNERTALERAADPCAAAGRTRTAAKRVQGWTPVTGRRAEAPPRTTRPPGCDRRRATQAPVRAGSATRDRSC